MGGSIHIETKHHCGLWPALVDPTQLELAILNLAINARDAMQVGGTLKVETENATLGPRARPKSPPPAISWRSAYPTPAPGMTDEVRAKVFEPFFTTKEVGKGSGLGLSQVLGFAKQSGGGVCIESRPGAGTSRAHLPSARRGQARQAGCRAGPRRPRRRPIAGLTVLLIDDDNAVREVTARHPA